MATTVLITGANRGLGRAFVEVFLSRSNHTVVGAVRDPGSSSSQSLKSVTTGQGSSLVLVKIDSASLTDARVAVETIKEAGISHLDVVIANAGISGPIRRVEGIELEDMREVFEVNTFGVVSLFKAVYPLLKATADTTDKNHRQPVFVGISSNLSSILNLEADAALPAGAYGASKAALNYLVRRIHFENEWLTAFVAHPGFAQTDMGNAAAKSVGLEQAAITAKEGVDGVVKHIDGATRESTSGKFFSYDGSEMLF